MVSYVPVLFLSLSFCQTASLRGLWRGRAGIRRTKSLCVTKAHHFSLLLKDLKDIFLPIDGVLPGAASMLAAQAHAQGSIFPSSIPVPAGRRAYLAQDTF